ncbi:hypothetical protein [Nocardia anaemiae]|uniref:hypothetical protein n=1 Tax=Nocardia anaemiae TaxID=263910 RepID=UPI0007A55189|nr:hypothetical protein [Nocardia anaemiae]
MALPDKGQKNAQAAYDAAKTGLFQLPEDGAKRLAASCDTLADGLQDEIAAAWSLVNVTGFPDLPSGHALAKGFSAKGREYIEALTALRETVLRYKAAYLAAGKQFEDADAANRAAIKVATDQLEDPA